MCGTWFCAVRSEITSRPAIRQAPNQGGGSLELGGHPEFPGLAIGDDGKRGGPVRIPGVCACEEGDGHVVASLGRGPRPGRPDRRRQMVDGCCLYPVCNWPTTNCAGRTFGADTAASAPTANETLLACAIPRLVWIVRHGDYALIA